MIYSQIIILFQDRLAKYAGRKIGAYTENLTFPKKEDKMSLFAWLRSKQKETDSKYDHLRAITVGNAIARLSNAHDESRAVVAIVLACLMFSSCNRTPQPVTGSFSLRLVHPQNTELIYAVLPPSQNDLSGYSLLPAHPAATREDLPNQYWVSESELISYTDLASAKLFMPPKSKIKPLTREDYDAVTKEDPGYLKKDLGFRVLWGKNYEDYLSKFRTYPGIELTFSSSGTSKFASVTSQNLNRHLAIVVDGQVLMAPKILEPIPDGMAQITGSFSEEEVKEIIRKIYGE